MPLAVNRAEKKTEDKEDSQVANGKIEKNEVKEKEEGHEKQGLKNGKNGRKGAVQKKDNINQVKLKE